MNPGKNFIRRLSVNVQHKFYSKAQCTHLRKVNMPADTFLFKISHSNWGWKSAPVYIWTTSCLAKCHVRTHGSGHSYSPVLSGEWRKLHNEELNDLYCSPNIVRVIKSKGNIPTGRPRHRWEDTRKMCLHWVGWWSTDWIELPQNWDRCWVLVNAVMNLQVP